MIFVHYSKGKEYWATPEKFAAKREKQRSSRLKRMAANPAAMRKIASDWRKANPDKMKASKAKHRSANLARLREEDRLRAIRIRSEQREKIQSQSKARYAANPEKFKAKNKLWAKANPEKINAGNRAKFKRRRETNPLFVLSSRIRSRMHNALKREGFKKSAPIASILGCDWPTIKAHIESQFAPKMSWDNRHLWEIDHVIPLGSAASEEEIIKLSHFSNLAPMWELVNNAKADLMPDEWAKISHLYTDYLPEELLA